MRTCQWLVEQAFAPTPPNNMPEECLDAWHEHMSEIYAECGGVEIVECGADVIDITDGWQCAAGHHYYNYGSRSQQFEEQAEAWAERYQSYP